jgi:hypothetical protein
VCRWCLGKAGEAPKTGIVVFAPGARDHEGGDKEQRHIGVVSEEDVSKVYWFRGSWLKRALVQTGPGEKSAFKVGARVQLNPAKWAFTAESHGKKCLGCPSDAAYGLVVNTGLAQKDGSMRNMEV